MSFEALLLGYRDAICDPAGPFDYGVQGCDLRADGQPPPRCGAWFVSIHQLRSSSQSVNNLDEYFSVGVTLTGRVVNAPLDRIGDVMLASLFAAKTGFNKRLRKLGAFLHMNWSVLTLANNHLIQLNEDAEIVYGFAEPARLASTEMPQLVDGTWFDADPKSANVGLKALLTFEGARRLQPLGTFT